MTTLNLLIYSGSHKHFKHFCGIQIVQKNQVKIQDCGTHERCSILAACPIKKACNL